MNARILRPGNSDPSASFILESEKIRYSCPCGSVLEGSSERRCLRSGVLSGVQPRCIGLHKTVLSYTQWIFHSFIFQKSIDRGAPTQVLLITGRWSLQFKSAVSILEMWFVTSVTADINWLDHVFDNAWRAATGMALKPRAHVSYYSPRGSSVSKNAWTESVIRCKWRQNTTSFNYFECHAP